MLNKAIKLIEEENFEAAKEILLKLEKSPEVKGYLGLSDYNLKNYESAQINLIEAIIEKYEDKFALALEKLLIETKNDEALLGVKIFIYDAHKSGVQILRDITELAGKLKKFDIALEYYKILLEKCPKDYVALNNLGLIYEEINEWEKAYDCYKKALNLKDFFSPNFNLGIISRKLGKFGESIKYLKKAVQQNPTSPQPKYSLAMSYMMLKDFENGYPLYAKHMTKIMPSFYKNEWDGTPHPDKTLCIFATGGLGDMIMFSRYFEYVKNSFKKIYLLLPDNLEKIFKINFPYIEIINSKNIFTNFDFAITPMHILKLFNLDFNKVVPGQEGFFVDDKELTKKFKNEIFKSNKLKIGINWHGKREGTRTFFNRSMKLSALEPLFEEFKNAEFYSVQKDESHKELEKYPFIIDLYDKINDFNDTSSILKNLDFLVSIDSSPVHMAGALGVKTYMFLPKASEWRWFVEGDKTIWYNSVELIRQNVEGNWDFCTSKLIEKLKAKVD